MIAKKISQDFIFELLEQKVREFNSPAFIPNDPISIPHKFSKKQDIEIMGFWTAMLAWGNRKSIIASANRLIELMDHAPYEFVLRHTEHDLKKFLSFHHRTFNATDALYFIEFFRHYYQRHDSLEEAFLYLHNELKPISPGQAHKKWNPELALSHFHKEFFCLVDSPARTRKHVATPLRGSTCKRINMFLRWMVRKDSQGVDFGLWEKISRAQLLCPLDLHVDRTARKLGLISRKQTDWETVIELTQSLKVFDPMDPVKYDFALFGISVLDKLDIPSLSYEH